MENLAGLNIQVNEFTDSGSIGDNVSIVNESGFGLSFDKTIGSPKVNEVINSTTTSPG